MDDLKQIYVVTSSVHVPREFGPENQLRSLADGGVATILLTINGKGDFLKDKSLLEYNIFHISYNLVESDKDYARHQFADLLKPYGVVVLREYRWPHELDEYDYITSYMPVKLIQSKEAFINATGHIAKPSLDEHICPKPWDLTWVQNALQSYNDNEEEEMNSLVTMKTDLTTVPHAPSREMVSVSLSGMFDVLLKPRVGEDGKELVDENGRVLRKDLTIPAFKDPGPFTPERNPHYKFNKDHLIALCMAMQEGGRLYIRGHSGTGKTEFLRQVAARLNYNFLCINFDGSLMRSDLVGVKEIVNEKGVPVTKFRHGLIPLALTLPGTIIVLDEVDACPPETAFVLQRMVSEDQRFLLVETNEIFTLHPQNVITATANTNGMGDDTGLYVGGTNVMNFSFLNRFDYTLEMDYLSEKEELQLLLDVFADEVKAGLFTKTAFERIATVAHMVRESFKNNQIRFPLTTRDVLSWCRKLCLTSEVMKAAEYSFLNRMSRSDAMAVANIIQRVIRLSDKESSKYVATKAVEKAI